MSSESQKSLHICHVTTAHTWNDPRIFQRMCCSLAEMGLRVTLVAPVEEEGVAQGVRVIPTGLRGKMARLCGAPFLLPMLRRIDADIYHFHDPELLPWMSLFQALNPSAAVVYDVHEYHPERFIHQNYLIYKHLSFLTSGMFKSLEVTWGTRLRGVIGVTEPIANRFRGSRARVAVIRNLVKLGSILDTGEPYGTGIASQEGGHRLLILGGTINRYRCMEELVVAMGLLKERGLQLQLLCFGEPHPKGFGDHLMALADQCGIAGLITLLGVMPFGQYQQHVAQSALGMVLYAPGINNSMGVPNRLYEFMAHGIPIISSDFPEVARVVRDAECGILVNSSNPSCLADAMEFLLTHPEEAARMGANGRKAIEDRYSWEREFGALLEFYLEIMNHGRGRFSRPLQPSRPECTA